MSYVKLECPTCSRWSDAMSCCRRLDDGLACAYEPKGDVAAVLAKARDAVELEAVASRQGAIRFVPPESLHAHAEAAANAMLQSALEKQVGGNHYAKMKIQPAEFIHMNGLGFLEGCIVKRICRWRDKDGIKDLEKIKHEVDLLIELEEKKSIPLE